jgi:hypothetical protein
MLDSMCRQNARRYDLDMFNILWHPEKMNGSGGPAPLGTLWDQIAHAEMLLLGCAYVGFATCRYNLTS